MNKLTNLEKELFPQQSSALTNKELDFLKGYRQLKKTIIDKWKPLCTTIALPKKTISDISFRSNYLLTCLYSIWSRLFVDDDRAEIEIPNKDLVGKFSRPPVYYMSGWTLQRASLALTVAEDDRDKYKSFAISHGILTMQQAKEGGLPSSLVEMRQKLFFATKEYFEFMLFIESIYVKNLNLKQMMAHSDGDLVNAINETIYNSDVVRTKFFHLFGRNDAVEDDDRLDILYLFLSLPPLLYVAPFSIRSLWSRFHFVNQVSILSNSI